MNKVISVCILLISAIVWGKGEPVKYGQLRQRLVIQATEDVNEVDLNVELNQPRKDAPNKLKIAAYNQVAIKKNNFYRISFVRSYDAYNTAKASLPDTVFNIMAEELKPDLQPTGNTVKLASKAKNETVVGNFIQHSDELANSPTLQTGRAQVGDYVVNTLATKLNHEEIPAYSRLKVISITDEYIPFTLAFKYTLRLRDERTGRLYDLAAPGLTQLPIWALLVAPQNRRVIKFWGGELHY